jgi:hypothetical protein
MRATKIKMKSGCGKSDNLLEIDSVYVTGCTNPGYYKCLLPLFRMWQIQRCKVT